MDEAILVIERLALGSHEKRRGRPPAWLSEMKKKGPQGARRLGRPPGSKNRKESAAA